MGGGGGGGGCIVINVTTAYYDHYDILPFEDWHLYFHIVYSKLFNLLPYACSSLLVLEVIYYH